MSSMKNGFTLVEILLSIILISLITVASFFYMKSEKETEEVTEFKNTLKLSANVYLEDIKLDSNRTQITEPNDCIYIKLEDLVGEGLLKEEDDNPVMSDTIKNSANSIIKIYMNEDYEIDIEYPATDMSVEDYEIPVIILNNNTEEYNKYVLPDSYEILNLYKSNSSIINKIKTGEYTTWVDPGKKLMNAKGEIINTVDDDWELNKSWNQTKREWTYTWSIKSSGPSNIENRDEIKSVSRVVKLIDNFHPILVDQYNGYYEYYGEEIILRSYYGYVDPYYYDNYIKFDNFDGITYYPFESLDIFDYSYSYGLLSREITLEDTATPKNIKNYNLNFSLWENSYPEVYYWGDTWFYSGDISTSYFASYIDYWDPDGDSVWMDYYLYNNWDGTWYYSWEDTWLYSGNYSLYIDVYDDYDGWNSTYADIYIEDYPYYEDPWYDPWYEEDYYEDDYYDDWYCDDACIIEHMQDNSDAWWGADEEERDRLHEENEWWSDQLSDNVWFDDGSGYWYDSSGDILYGDSYDDGWYDDYYYDDYYYDDYYYDDYYGDYYYDYYW